ncbi:MAG: SGNH/GDSL hydrolase family protein [Anaerolineae bacterium]
MIIQSNSKLLMIGDSITDCERGRPIGDIWPGALGNGYVNFVDALLMARYPAHHIRVVNMGVNANTVMDLKARWQTDVLDLKPDWLSICIGINDVWWQFAMPHGVEKHIPLDKYSQTLDELVTVTKPTLKGMILMTPYYIEPNRSEPVRAMMDEYGTAVRQIAEKHQAVLVDTQAAFDEVLSQVHSSALATDRVHPTQAGHMILARAFVRAIGYEWE